jgi:predicted nucleic acid-binding protein
MVLVDTSVWVDHLRRGSARLQELLLNEQVLGHPFVVGELACGTLRNREEVLVLLRTLPQVRPAEHEEVLHLVESERVQGRGIGWVDAHLLASALISRCSLWTLDARLDRVAKSLAIGSR